MKKHRVILAACIAAMLSAVLISSAQQRNSTAAYLSFLSPVSVNEFTYAGGGGRQKVPSRMKVPNRQRNPNLTKLPSRTKAPNRQRLFLLFPNIPSRKKFRTRRKAPTPRNFRKKCLYQTKKRVTPPHNPRSRTGKISLQATAMSYPFF